MKWKDSRAARSVVHQQFFSMQYTDLGLPDFQTHKLNRESLLNVEVKDKPVGLLQSAGNISTSSITAFLRV